MTLRLPVPRPPKSIPRSALFSSLSKAQSTQHPTSPSSSTSSARNPSPTPNAAAASEIINPSKLAHLLRLSALPLPISPAAEARLLSTLQTQLQFVRDLQDVDTEGVEPLVCIRDQSEGAIKDLTYTAENMKGHIDAHKRRGKRGWRRREGEERGKEVDEEWDVLGQATMRQGRFFFVKREGTTEK